MTTPKDFSRLSVYHNTYCADIKFCPCVISSSILKGANVQTASESDSTLVILAERRTCLLAYWGQQNEVGRWSEEILL